MSISGEDVMAGCRFVAKGLPRLIAGRHLDDCESNDCESCLPCLESHCIVCTRNHLKPDQQTCPSCVYDVREYLHNIVRLYGDLRDQARHGANMNGKLLAGAPIPGGDAMVMLAGGGSEQIQRQLVARGHLPGEHLSDDESDGDPESIEYVLTSWEDELRIARSDPAAGMPSIESASVYLHEHLTWAAQQHPDFPDFAKHMRRTWRRLQSVLDDRDPTVTGVRCLSLAEESDCDGDLKQYFSDPAPAPGTNSKDQGGRRDYWECTRCDRIYRDDDYRRAVDEVKKGKDPWATAAELAEVHRVQESTIRWWKHRGFITITKREKGRTMYDKAEVAEYVARKLAA